MACNIAGEGLVKVSERKSVIIFKYKPQVASRKGANFQYGGKLYWKLLLIAGLSLVTAVLQPLLIHHSAFFCPIAMKYGFSGVNLQPF